MPVRPARLADVPADPDLRHAFGTDPDSAFVFEADGEPAGFAAGALRGEVFQVVALEVPPAHRGRGHGTALWTALRGSARERGAKGVELLVPAEPLAAGFVVSRGLPLRSTVLKLEANPASLAPEEGAGDATGTARRPRLGATLGTAGLPTGLSGWVLDLDRAARGFPRRPEWSAWLSREGAEVLAIRRRGRPEGVAAIRRSGRVALVGPVEVAAPELLAGVLPPLARRAAAAGATRVEAYLPAEARAAIESAFSAGFRVTEAWLLVATRPRGDFRRYAGGGPRFF